MLSLSAGADDPEGDLSAIGDQKLLNHADDSTITTEVTEITEYLFQETEE